MNCRAKGNEYEQKAAEFLEGQGMTILARNFRNRRGEIDLIAREKECLVFVEVKYRGSTKHGMSLEAVDIQKQKTIAQTARFFLYRYGYGEDTHCRFDVIGIDQEQITHIKDAFWMG